MVTCAQQPQWERSAGRGSKYLSLTQLVLLPPQDAPHHSWAEAQCRKQNHSWFSVWQVTAVGLKSRPKNSERKGTEHRDQIKSQPWSTPVAEGFNEESCKGRAIPSLPAMSHCSVGEQCPSSAKHSHEECLCRALPGHLNTMEQGALHVLLFLNCPLTFHAVLSSPYPGPLQTKINVFFLRRNCSVAGVLCGVAGRRTEVWSSEGTANGSVTAGKGAREMPGPL